MIDYEGLILIKQEMIELSEDIDAFIDDLDFDDIETDESFTDFLVDPDDEELLDNEYIHV